ncbi:MAG: hypothetical protein H0W56_09455 [Acidothermales bacterium]|nr:hypothetical protein [Acidothermales bacterium]
MYDTPARRVHKKAHDLRGGGGFVRRWRLRTAVASYGGGGFVRRWRWVARRS